MSHEPNNAQVPLGSLLEVNNKPILTDKDIRDQLPFGGTVAVGQAAMELAKAEADERVCWESWWLAKERLEAARKALAAAVNERAKLLEKVKEVREF